MDNKLEILLNSEKNINSVNVDTSTKLNLVNKTTKINEYNVRNILSVTELFDLEREENQIYRIYGGFEYLSLLNGLKQDYSELSDFFRPQTTEDTKNIFNSFDIYLVRPSDDEYEKIQQKGIGLTNNPENLYGVENPTLTFPTTLYKRKFKILTKLENFEIYNAGFSKNLFNEKKYIYSFNIDFDVSELLDGFGMPLTELYVFVQYKPTEFEKITHENWNNIGDVTTNEFSPVNYNIGDTLKNNYNENICDLVEFSEPRFFQRLDTQQTFRIKTPVSYEIVEEDKFVGAVLYTTDCDLVDSFVDPNSAESFSEYEQDVIIEIDEPQTVDVLIQYRRISEEFIDGVGQGPSSTITDVTITAGDTNVVKNDLPCRYEEVIDTGNGIMEIEVITTYELVEENIFVESGGAEEFNIDLVWRYNPLIPIKLRYFEDNLNVVNKDSDSQEDLDKIPDYAFELNNGDMVWRNIMPEGFINPLTNLGTNHPFLNKKRYLFKNIVLNINPDLLDDNTRETFSNIWFDRNTIPITNIPNSDLDNINDPC